MLMTDVGAACLRRQEIRERTTDVRCSIRLLISFFLTSFLSSDFRSLTNRSISD